ncbi:MAG: hypothetical protein LBU51_08700 [Bacteroidales bacterium]|jgi:C-terminal processing protease CtpA/Prc|nr:hypothetical protein [Bacteroidales bacterium]
MKANLFKIILTFLIVPINYCSAQKEDIHRVNEEQKIYELSFIWKELSYNFANMDNCPGLDMDSLYRAYLPIVQKTKNDFDYFLAINRFLAHFNNGHVLCNFPEYVWHHVNYPLLKTKHDKGSIYIDNIGYHYSNDVRIDDQILSINGISALDYFNQYAIPYIPVSNEEVKIDFSMFGSHFDMQSYSLKKDKTKLKLKVFTAKGIKKVTIPYDIDVYPSPKDTAKQHQKHYIDQSCKIEGNVFVVDTANKFTYISLTECNDDFFDFFWQKYDTILKYENLIVDVSHNNGGDGNAVVNVLCCLIDNDSIYTYSEKTRKNIALHKAWATTKILYYEDKDVPDFYKTEYYPYYYHTAFEDIKYGEGAKFANIASDSQRFKGNIYVITGLATASATEYFTVMLTQNKKVKFLGKKTVGALGQPLVVNLPSGMRVFINTTKTYDFNGNDISSGFTPDYIYDFSSFYKTENPNELLQKFIEVIKSIK